MASSIYYVCSKIMLEKNNMVSYSVGKIKQAMALEPVFN